MIGLAALVLAAVIFSEMARSARMLPLEQAVLRCDKPRAPSYARVRGAGAQVLSLEAEGGL